jgi:hypothetical protein
MSALKNPILVVLDNASYHNVKTEDTVWPNFGQKKLFSKTILHNTTFLFLIMKSPSFDMARNTKSQRQSNPHLAYQHAKQSNVCLYPRVFVGHQTHHSEATYNLCSDLVNPCYTYAKIGDNRRVLYDQVSIINDGCNYLRKIKYFMEAGYANETIGFFAAFSLLKRGSNVFTNFWNSGNNTKHCSDRLNNT